MKFWRGRRGLSQLDLALSAGVSSRHVSFLETGRSLPSIEMVRLLGATLDLSLRDCNDLLRAAGFAPSFAEPPLSLLEDDAIARALTRMLAQQEPYPMIVMNASYDILQLNRSAQRLLVSIAGETSGPLNALRILFAEGPLRDCVVHWEATARELLGRLQRECLRSPNDDRLARLLAELLEYPGVPRSWRQPDLSQPARATAPVSFRVGEHELSFLTTVMRFQAPQNVTLEELQIESWFANDAKTEALCNLLASA